MAHDDALDPQELAAWEAFQRAQTLLAGALARELQQETGLSEADFQLLTALHAAPGGRLRSIELRCAVLWEKSRLSHQLRRMEERGLVRRETCAEDGRSADVVLTADGREAAIRGACARARSVRRHVIEPLGPERLGDLAAIATVIDATLRNRLAPGSDAAWDGDAAAPAPVRSERA